MKVCTAPMLWLEQQESPMPCHSTTGSCGWARPDARPQASSIRRAGGHRDLRRPAIRPLAQRAGSSEALKAWQGASERELAHLLPSAEDAQWPTELRAAITAQCLPQGAPEAQAAGAPCAQPAGTAGAVPGPVQAARPGQQAPLYEGRVQRLRALQLPEGPGQGASLRPQAACAPPAATGEPPERALCVRR